jgi:uncharacterized membrane protein HdeD (DUF308 family)
MLTIFSRHWWHFALRGLFAIVFGFLALVWPLVALVTLVILFGAFALANGILAVVTGIASFRSDERHWAVLISGLAGIIVGVLTFLWSGVTGIALLYLIAAWAVVTGIFETAGAIRLRKIIHGEALMLLSGILSVIFGLILFVFPGAGAISMVWLISAYAIVFGILLIIFGFRLRALKKEIDKPSA